MTEARIVPAAKVPFAWPEVEAFLDAACQRTQGDTTLPELLALCERGAGTLWAIWLDKTLVGAGVTQVSPQSDGRLACYVLAVGAEGSPDWPAIAAAVETDARTKGCALMRWVGRPGWGRRLPGYETTAVMLAKEL